MSSTNESHDEHASHDSDSKDVETNEPIARKVVPLVQLAKEALDAHRGSWAKEREIAEAMQASRQDILLSSEGRVRMKELTESIKALVVDKSVAKLDKQRTLEQNFLVKSQNLADLNLECGKLELSAIVSIGKMAVKYTNTEQYIETVILFGKLLELANGMVLNGQQLGQAISEAMEASSEVFQEKLLAVIKLLEQGRDTL